MGDNSAGVVQDARVVKVEGVGTPLLGWERRFTEHEWNRRGAYDGHLAPCVPSIVGPQALF